MNNSESGAGGKVDLTTIARSGFQSFEDWFMYLYGKDEFYYTSIMFAVVLILIVIGCCLGCRGCCCRACCCAKSTKFHVSMWTLPKRFSGLGRSRCCHEPTVICCHHPHHCQIDRHTQQVCHCRLECVHCNQCQVGNLEAAMKPTNTCKLGEPNTKSFHIQIETAAPDSNTSPKPIITVKNEHENQEDYHPPVQRPPRRPKPNPRVRQTDPSVPGDPVNPEGTYYRPPPNAWSYTNTTPYKPATTTSPSTYPAAPTTSNYCNVNLPSNTTTNPQPQKNVQSAPKPTKATNFQNQRQVGFVDPKTGTELPSTDDYDESANW